MPTSKKATKKKQNHHLHGGFLPLLLGALAPAVGALLKNGFDNAQHGKNFFTGNGMVAAGKSGGSHIHPLIERNQMVIGSGRRTKKKRTNPTKESAWVKHVKAYAKEHGIKYGEAMKKAKATYRSGKGISTK
jgi:hypothetical protein